MKKLRGSKRRIRAEREDDKLDGEEGRCELKAKDE